MSDTNQPKPSSSGRSRRRRKRSSSQSSGQQAPNQQQNQAQAGNEQPNQSNQKKRSSGGKRSRGRKSQASRGPVRIIPMGGVGEVGKNATVVEHGPDLIMMDAGAKFPEEHQHSIDLVIPDVSYVKSNLDKLRGIVITHGHEDHIGGIPYILNQLEPKQKIPIYGSPLAIGLIEHKVRESRTDKMVDLHVVEPGQRVSLGNMVAEFIHVTHSIPDTNAIAIHTSVGTIIDTADFKFDPTPVMGKPTSERRLRKLGDAGVLALLSDTVRVETAGSTPSERIVFNTIKDVTSKAKGQIILATFASNVSRLKMAIDAAAKNGRVVAVAGRSMEQSARVSTQLGYLSEDSSLLRPLDEVLKLPPHKRFIVATGSQGEPAAALARISMNAHAKIRIAKDDVVIVSATPIPGNEETVTRTIDNLFRRGATVVYSAIEKGVHVSGHGGRDELRKMLELVRPKFAIPIHGEYRHMSLYRDLCAEVGIPEDRVLFPEIGGVIELTPNSARRKGNVKSGTVLVDRLSDRSRAKFLLRDPEKMTADGMAIVTFVVRSDTGKLIAGPNISGVGLKPEINSAALRAAENDLRKAMKRLAKGEAEYAFLARRSKEVVAKSLYRKSKSRPLILPALTVL